MYVLPTPAGDWDYALDEPAIHYGSGWWPVYTTRRPHDEQETTGPTGIRIAPDTECRSGRNEYVQLTPTSTIVHTSRPNCACSCAPTVRARSVWTSSPASTCASNPCTWRPEARMPGRGQRSANPAVPAAPPCPAPRRARLPQPTTNGALATVPPSIHGGKPHLRWLSPQLMPVSALRATDSGVRGHRPARVTPVGNRREVAVAVCSSRG